MRRWILVAAMVAVVAAACGVGDDEGGATTTTTTTVPSGGEPDGPEVVAPRPGMSGVTARPFESWQLEDDGVTLLIEFWSGVEPCYVLDHVDVASDEDTVTITLFEGHEPQDEDVACIEIAVLKAVRVTLDEPLGDRQVVDGSAVG